jgi:hypothetical protein
MTAFALPRRETESMTAPPARIIDLERWRLDRGLPPPRRAPADPSAHAKPQARIFRPSPSPMQAGRASTRRWILEFEPTRPPEIEPLVGWVASDDPLCHVRIDFSSREAAVAFAERQGWRYTVIEPQAPRVRPQSYAQTLLRDAEGRLLPEATSPGESALDDLALAA